MAPMTNNQQKSEIRRYDLEKSAVVFKTREEFGALSNMAGGFPLRVNGVDIRTSEALYQACRFPDFPDIQYKIIAERSPMSAKMKSKPYRHKSRSDWNQVRVEIMRWCLKVKLAQHWEKFGDALRETKHLDIVERSRRDDFWGARLMQDDTLVGTNALGRLLMELRDQIAKEPPNVLQRVEPLPIRNFRLLDEQIGKICPRQFQLSDHCSDSFFGSSGNSRAGHRDAAQDENDLPLFQRQQ